MAAISSSMVTSPLPLRSMAGQTETGCEPRAMITPRMSSSTLTTPSPSQSPKHGMIVGVGDGCGESVGVGTGVSVAVGGGVSVAVDAAVPVATDVGLGAIVSVGVGDTPTVTLTLGLGLGVDVGVAVGVSA